MSKRFIVVVDDNAPPFLRNAQNDRFVAYAKGKGMGWWCWIPSFWLLVDGSGKMTAKQLSSDVHDIFYGRCFVAELREGEGTWSGYGSEEMFEWVRDNWDPSQGTPFSPGRNILGEAGRRKVDPNLSRLLRGGKNPPSSRQTG